MKAGRDEPLYFSWGDKQTADHPESDRTGPDQSVGGGGGVWSDPVHLIQSPFFLLPPPPAVLPSLSPSPSASQQLKAEPANQSGGPEKPFRLQTVKPRPCCVFRWHPIGCLLRGKKQIKTEIQKIK